MGVSKCSGRFHSFVGIRTRDNHDLSHADSAAPDAHPFQATRRRRHTIRTQRIVPFCWRPSMLGTPMATTPANADTHASNATANSVAEGVLSHNANPLANRDRHANSNANANYPATRRQRNRTRRKRARRPVGVRRRQSMLATQAFKSSRAANPLAEGLRPDRARIIKNEKRVGPAPPFAHERRPRRAAGYILPSDRAEGESAPRVIASPSASATTCDVPAVPKNW